MVVFQVVLCCKRMADCMPNGSPIPVTSVRGCEASLDYTEFQDSLVYTVETLTKTRQEVIVVQYYFNYVKMCYIVYATEYYFNYVKVCKGLFMLRLFNSVKMCNICLCCI